MSTVGLMALTHARACKPGPARVYLVLSVTTRNVAGGKSPRRPDWLRAEITIGIPAQSSRIDLDERIGDEVGRKECVKSPVIWAQGEDDRGIRPVQGFMCIEAGARRLKLLNGDAAAEPRRQGSGARGIQSCFDSPFERGTGRPYTPFAPTQS